MFFRNVMWWHDDVIKYLLVPACSLEFSLNLVPPDQVSSSLHFGNCVFQKCHMYVMMTSSGTWYHMLNQIFFSPSVYWPSFMLFFRNVTWRHDDVIKPAHAIEFFFTTCSCWSFWEVFFSRIHDLVPTDQVSCWPSMLIAFWEVCFSDMSRDVMMTSSSTCLAHAQSNFLFT